MLRIAFEGKWLILGFGFSAAVVAAIISLFIADVYRAQVLLAPNSNQAGSGLAGLAAQYGGLASLAGFEFGGSNEVDKAALGIEILRSRKFIFEFVETHDLLVPLVAARDWDRATAELVLDTDDYDPASQSWIRRVSAPRKTVPTSQEAYEEFIARLNVSQDKVTQFIRVSFEHYSPEIARQWLEWLVEDLNATVMAQDVAEAQHSIEYLNTQIAATSSAELRAVFYSLIKEQTKTIMLASVSDEYLFKTVDPPVAPERKVAPKRAVIVVLAATLGCLLVYLLLLMRHVLRNDCESDGS